MLYIGNHTTSSKGYENMARQMIANGGTPSLFLQEIPEAGRLRKSMRKI